MKKILLSITAVITLALTPAFAQMGGQGPQFDGAMNKLFGDNKTFSATLEIHTGGGGNEITMPGKFNYDTGKSRFELNITDVQGSAIPPNAVKQMKSMGMDETIAISRPDLKSTYLVYPGLKSYAELTAQDASGNTSQDDYKVETAEAGKETVDGHDCKKNKVTVTGKDGVKHEFTVWNATDLKNFPVKIQTDAGGHDITMSYKNVSMTKPAASLFEAPSGFTEYTNVQTMIQTEMMKHAKNAAPSAQ